MKNECVKKSLGKSKNVLEEKRKKVQAKICIKKINAFTIIAVNFVQEQLKLKFLTRNLEKNMCIETRVENFNKCMGK